jgi:hypothetical protein
MDDLSAGLRDLAVTSQQAGAASGRDDAHSAPGSGPLAPAADLGDPDVTATAYDGRHLVHGRGES